MKARARQLTSQITRASLLACLLTCLLACATTAQPGGVSPAGPTGAKPATDGEPTASTSAATPTGDALRTLDVNATFADLARLARSFGTSAQASSEAGCLLARDADQADQADHPAGHVLLADLMPSLEGMPDPPTDLAARMREHAGPVAMLTAWGAAGSPQAKLVLASFTTTPANSADAPFVLLAIDGDEAFIRSSATTMQDARAVPIAGAVAQARALLASKTGTPSALYVTAGASTTLMELRAALKAFEPALLATTAFAVLLPAGTTPPSTQPAPVAADLCPEGLPEPGDVNFGELSREAITPTLTALREGITPCLSTLRSASARVVIGLRIDDHGQALHACLLDAGGIDPRTATCVLLTARELKTPAPSPKGIVDLHLPLLLQAEGPQAQRALCDP